MTRNTEKRMLMVLRVEAGRAPPALMAMAGTGRTIRIARGDILENLTQKILMNYLNAGRCLGLGFVGVNVLLASLP